jgi:hypothetical protein
MAAKTVTLIHPDGTEHTFEAAHAARILALPDPGGWVLKEGQKIDTTNADNRTGAKGKAAKAAAPEDDCGCN